LRHLTGWSVTRKEVHAAGGVPETKVDMAGGASPALIGFGHEGDRASAEMSDLLGALLVDGGPVSRLQCVVVVDVDFMLPRSGFSL